MSVWTLEEWEHVWTDSDIVQEDFARMEGEPIGGAPETMSIEFGFVRIDVDVDAGVEILVDEKAKCESAG